jgi:hypothetical protein
MNFYRSQYTELWITLSSDEVLGVLDSSYIEDYFGVDGQITLRHENGTPYTVLMNELSSETPNIPHDVFTGLADLDSIPDGNYYIEGRVRDVIGNYTILHAVENPLGSERVLNLQFKVVEGYVPSGYVVNLGPLKLMGGITLTSNFKEDIEITTQIKALSPIKFSLSEVVEFNSYLREATDLFSVLQSDLEFVTKEQTDQELLSAFQLEPILNTELRGD